MELEECWKKTESYIPDGILMEILSRLPLKMKLKLKRVSKSWHSIISDTDMGKTLPWDILFRYSNGVEFGKMLPAESMMGVHVTSKHYPEFTSPNFSLQFLENRSPQDQPNRLMATSNGLFLCCKNLYPQTGYCVCNPITAERVSLPNPPTSLLHNYVRILHDYVNLGFISQDGGGYKVVRIIKPLRSSTIRIDMEIFSSDIGEWKTVRVKCLKEVKFGPICHPAVICNGIMLWITYLNGILAYDPNANSCRIIDYPNE